MEVSPRQARQEKARRKCVRSLAAFTKYLWPVINPGHPLQWNWHMDVLCQHLESVTRGEIRRLIINVPPGSSKSTIVSIMWPTWEWLSHPSMRFIGASYELALSTIFNVKRRQIITSARYQSLRPPFQIVKGQKEKKLFKNSAMGTMRSVSTGSAVTGDHCDRLVIDDPLDPEGIYGPDLVDHVRWFDETASSRFTDLTKAVWVIVMQRLHEEDLSGVLLAENDGDIVHVEIQAEYDPDNPQPWDPRYEKGESFFKSRFPREILMDKKKRGTLQYSAQYNQRPTSAEGNMIMREWWRYWSKLPDLRGAVWAGVWDTAYESGERHDYTVGQVWVALGQRAYMVDQVRRKMGFVEMAKVAEEMSRRWPRVGFWHVEERALGPALIDQLRAKGVRVKPFKSQSTKEQRAHAILPMMEMGQIYIPAEDCERPPMLEARYTWTLPAQMDAFLDECSSFPRSKHDDQVDAMAFALGELAAILQAVPEQRSRRQNQRQSGRTVVKPRASRFSR